MTQFVLCRWCTLSIDQGDAQFSCSTLILTHIAKVQCNYCVYYSFIDKCAIALKLFQLPEHPWMKIISHKRKQDSSRLLKCWMVMHCLSLKFWAALWILLKMIIGLYNKDTTDRAQGILQAVCKIVPKKSIHLFIWYLFLHYSKICSQGESDAALKLHCYIFQWFNAHNQKLVFVREWHIVHFIVKIILRTHRFQMNKEQIPNE